MNKLLRNNLISLFVILLSTISVSASVTNGTIDSTYKYAWSENLGWINFGVSNGNVRVTASALTGYAWSDKYGWINLAPSTSGVTNNGSGDLSGYAWGENVGWIDFNSVSINENGNFSGTASGTNSGQVSFNCSNCSVRTDWRPQCNNGLDDDSDSLVDYSGDPGCASVSDGSEGSDVKLFGSGGGGFFAFLTTQPQQILEEIREIAVVKIPEVLAPVVQQIKEPVKKVGNLMENLVEKLTPQKKEETEIAPTAKKEITPPKQTEQKEVVQQTTIIKNYFQEKVWKPIKVIAGKTLKAGQQSISEIKIIIKIIKMKVQNWLNLLIDKITPAP